MYLDMRSLPPLSAVRVFESAARHENFTRAANELGMTQAAVSYQIKLLEERLGTSLFHRAKGRLTLTDSGRRIAPLTSDAFDMLDRAFRTVRADDEQVLTISTMQSLATNWLAPRIGAFQLQRPQLAVRIRTEDRYVDFAADDVDVAIRAGTGTGQGLTAHFLMHSAVQPLASPDFVARHGPIMSASDVMRLPRLSADDVWWHDWARKMGLDNAPDTRVGIKLDSQLMEGNAAIAGHGIAILNALIWRNDMRSGRLVPVGDLVPGDRGFWLVYPTHRRDSPKIRAFRAWLDAEVKLLAEGEPAILFEQPAKSKENAG
jgi:LysR family transcriptional regulator, glycine cleavage system transcriptional activator